MRSLIRRQASADAAQDYAPSRLAYRMERLMLTPLIRKFLRLGLPVFALVTVLGMLVADERRRNSVGEVVAEIRTQLANRPEFLVRALTIDGASPALDQMVREVLSQDFPVSSFDLDLDAMQGAVVALDPVAVAQLHIGSGGMLRLNVTERVPVVVWRGPDGLKTFDAAGHEVAAIAERRARPDLPLIAGEGAEARIAEALELLAALGPVADRLRGLTLVGGRRWDVIFDHDLRILLPETAPQAALEQVLALNQAQEILERDVAVIDMRTPRRPTLRLATHAQSELQRFRLIQSGETLE